MGFSDLHEGVAELFGELQDAFEGDAVRELRAQPGFRVSRLRRGAGAKTPHGKAYMKTYMFDSRDAEVRKRLLAGDLGPLAKTTKTRGRPPTRWIRIASELGIAFNPPVAANTSAAPRMSGT